MWLGPQSVGHPRVGQKRDDSTNFIYSKDLKSKQGTCSYKGIEWALNSLRWQPYIDTRLGTELRWLEPPCPPVLVQAPAKHWNHDILPTDAVCG